MVAKILLYNAAGFIVAVLCFACFFPRRVAWGWGLAVLANIPGLMLLTYLLERHGDLDVAIALAVIVFIGLGGFGIGAIVGMIIASNRPHHERVNVNVNGHDPEAEPRSEPVRRSLRLKERVARWRSNREQ
jgi:hypothetical protein